jgi:hypothetical protein
MIGSHITIGIDLEAMHMRIRTAFTEYQDGINDQVRHHLEKACTPENLARIIAEETGKQVQEAIASKVRDFYRHGMGSRQIATLVEKTLADLDIGQGKRQP